MAVELSISQGLEFNSMWENFTEDLWTHIDKNSDTRHLEWFNLRDSTFEELGIKIRTSSSGNSIKGLIFESHEDALAFKLKWS